MHKTNSAAAHLPLISCIMPTYGRPDYVAESVGMFLAQDYPAKELIVFNDCPGQTFSCREPSVRVFNFPARFPTLGQKRNAAIEAAQGEWIAVWDDDDVYLPWRLSYSWEQISRHCTEFYRPAEFFAYWGDEFLRENQATPGWVSHAVAIFRKSLWRSVGGYPAIDMGEDAELFARIHRYLRQPFIKYAVDPLDRFMVLRGSSQYQHMSIGGGRSPLDTQTGVYLLESRSISEARLRLLVDGLIARRQALRPSPVEPAEIASAPPRLSVCISLRNRSRIMHGNKELSLFPNCVRSLKAAAESLGPLELIIADFHSDDLPLDAWLRQEASDCFSIRHVAVDGPFSRGRGLNVAARHASSSRLFLCDADIVASASALERGIEVLGQGRVYFPICRYTDEHGAPAFWQELGFGLVFVRRELLCAVGGVPEFESWGGEDDVLRGRLLDRAEEVRERQPGLLHQWHPDSCRHLNYQRSARADYEASQSQAAASSNVVRRFVGEHPAWGGPVREVHLFPDGRMVRPGVDSGTFELTEGARLVLAWDRWPAEVLEWDPVAKEYRDRSKPFRLREAGAERHAQSRAFIEALAAVRSEFASLADHLRSIAPFQFLSCPGNWGDATIRSGTLRFFRMLDLEFTELKLAGDAKPGLPAVLGGSGGFCRFWDWSPHAAVELLERSGELVVLPSTYERTALGWLREQWPVALYARERQSFECCSPSRAAYCPDMAFWNHPHETPPTKETLNAFRTDAESLGFSQQFRDNRDVSAERDHQGDAQLYFAEIGQYALVRTDRTHVAIAAAMLGRKVEFFPNAYHKNQAIFESCLRRFNVDWHSGAAGPPDRR